MMAQDGKPRFQNASHFASVDPGPQQTASQSEGGLPAGTVASVRLTSQAGA